MDPAELRKAAKIVTDVYKGISHPCSEFVAASDVVLNAMRSEITVNEMLKWCKDKGYVD